MKQTIHDVKRYLDIALKAVFLDEASQQARGHKPYDVKVDEKYEADDGLTGQVEFDRFTITPVKWEKVVSILQRRQDAYGWLVEIAVPVGGGMWDPPDVDVCEVGRFEQAHQAAFEVVKLLITERLEGAMESDVLAEEANERRQELEERF